LAHFITTIYIRLASNLPEHDLKALSTFIDALLLKQQVKNGK
jgi:hypothetical protein